MAVEKRLELHTLTLETEIDSLCQEAAVTTNVINSPSASTQISLPESLASAEISLSPPCPQISLSEDASVYDELFKTVSTTTPKISSQATTAKDVETEVSYVTPLQRSYNRVLGSGVGSSSSVNIKKKVKKDVAVRNLVFDSPVKDNI